MMSTLQTTTQQKSCKKVAPNFNSVFPSERNVVEEFILSHVASSDDSTSVLVKINVGSKHNSAMDDTPEKMTKV